MVNWAALVPLVLLPYVGGLAGSFLTRKNIAEWLDHLIKPSWNPPNWVFGPVWTTLYGMMGYSSYLAYMDSSNRALSLTLYGIQLALNWAWTPVFFAAHQVKYAFYLILVLDAFVLGTIINFFLDVSNLAGGLLIPYMCWLCLASALNYNIWRDNGDKPEPMLKHSLNETVN